MAAPAGLTRLHRRPLILPGTSVAPPPILRQTLFALAGTRQQTFDISDGTPTDYPGTAPWTHDGGDGTADGFGLTDLAFAGAGTSWIGWLMDPCTFLGPISECRIVARGNGTPIFGETHQLYGQVGFGWNFGPVGVLAPAFADYTFVAAVDPHDGLPWTAAKINAYHWGCEQEIFGIYIGESRTNCSEMKVEVWG